MIEGLSNAVSSCQDWVEEITESNEWDYYTQERAVFKGLPVAVVSSIAAGYLFQCASTSVAAVFGAVNYIALTTLLETIRAHHHIDNAKGMLLIAGAGAITLAFARTVCKASMTYQTAIILTAAAFAGQLSREYFMDKEFPR